MCNEFLGNLARFSRAAPIVLMLSLAACSSPEQRAQAHYESGKALLDKNDYVKAGLEFRNALKYNEKLATAWYGLALVEEKNRNIGGTLNALKRVVELDQKHGEAMIKLATLYLASGEVDQALSLANSAAELRADDTAVYATRAAVLLRLNDREGARRDAEKSLSLNPNNTDALGVLAADMLLDNNYANALTFVERGLSADPKNLALMLFKARIFELQKDDIRLEALLREMIAAYPEIPEMKKSLLSFLYSRNRAAEVETEMRKMLAANPDDREMALTFVSFVNQAKGTDAARTELAALIASHPNVAAFQFAAAKIDFSNNKFDEASKSLEAIIAKNEPKEDVTAARLLLAAMLFERKDFDAAGALVKTVLDADGKNAEGMALRAELRLKSNDFGGAVADAREALNQNPQSAPFHALLGKVYERQGSAELALEQYAEAAKLSNFEPSIAIQYADFLTARGKMAQAESVMNDARTNHPNNEKVLTQLGRLLIGQGKYEEAQKIAEEIKALGDTSGAGGQLLSSSLLGQKKYGEIISSVQTAQTPGDSQPMSGVIQAFVRENKLAEAEAFLQSALKANDKNAEVFVLLGGLRNAQKQPAEAEKMFLKAIEVQPDKSAGYIVLARHQAAQNRSGEAEQSLKEGMKHNPGNPSIVLALAGVYENSQRIEEAIGLYQEQLKVTPDALVIVNNLASLLADHRTDATSLDQADQISRRLEGVTSPHFKDTLGWIAYRRGQFDRASALLKEVSEKLPDVALVRYHLGMTYIAMKRKSDAVEQLTLAESHVGTDEALKAQIAAAKAAAAALP